MVEKKQEQTWEQRYATRLERVARRLPSPHREKVLEIAKGVLDGTIQVSRPSPIQKKQQWTIGMEIETPYGIGKIVEFVGKWKKVEILNRKGKDVPRFVYIQSK